MDGATQGRSVGVVESDRFAGMLLANTLEQETSFSVMLFGSAQEVHCSSDWQSAEYWILENELLDSSGLELGIDICEQVNDCKVLLLSNCISPHILSDVPANHRPRWSFVRKDSMASVSDFVQTFEAFLSTPIFSVCGESSVFDLAPETWRLLRHLATGLRTHVIASIEGVSPKTIEARIRALYVDLGVADMKDHNHRVLAARRARELGIVPSGPWDPLK